MRARARVGSSARGGGRTRRRSTSGSVRCDWTTDDVDATRAGGDGGDGGDDRGGGSWGGGGGFGGGGEGFGRRGRWMALGLGAALGTRRAGRADAASAAHERKVRTLGDMGTSCLYGFVIFYAIKLALKRLFAPVALFAFTTQLLWKMRALSASPWMMYNAWVRPRLPIEYQKNVEEFSSKALRTRAAENALHDGWWDKQERRFWACAHRLLPACNSPMGERALVFGIILAGLA